jgi:hypothetical protein
MDDKVADDPARNICPVIPLSSKGFATAFVKDTVVPMKEIPEVPP